MSLVILNAAEVATLLPVERCIEVMARAMAAVSDGTVAIPPRVMAPLPAGRGVLGLMPGVVNEPGLVGVKLATIMPANPAAGRPAIQGLVCVFDAETGVPSAVVEGAALTNVRTAAVSGLATRLLARNDAITHGIFGTGALVPGHIDAIFAARPSIERVLLWGRDRTKAEAMARREAMRTQRAVEVVDDPALAAACDVVTMVTAAKTPVMQGAWLRPGTHVNLVGPHRPDEREADTLTITRSRVYVDSMAGALREAGELLIPIQEGAFSQDVIVGEIGELVRGGIAGRTRHDEITLYKSLGSVAQDLFAADALLRLAAEHGRGVSVDF